MAAAAPPCSQGPGGRFALPVAGADVATISYSSLGDWERCGYRYYLRRVVGLPDVASPVPLAAGNAVARGRVVHALLERGGGELSDQLMRSLLCSEGLSDSIEEREHARGLARAFERSPLASRIAPAERVQREVAFAIPLGERAPLLTGYIDLLAREPGGRALVVDYKTDAVSESDSLAGRVARDYRAQQQVYALAVLRGGAREVDVAYCFLRRPEEGASERFVAEQIAELERDLLALAEPLMQARFEVSPRPHRELCARCPGRARLCSWGEEATLAEVD